MDTDRKIYELFQFVMNNEAHASLATTFRKALDDLQMGAQGFSPEQWTLIDNYLDAFSAVFQTMLTLALESSSDINTTQKLH